MDRAHVFADGGGRELGYVAMSRARGPSHLYATADDVDQAVEDLVAEWVPQHPPALGPRHRRRGWAGRSGAPEAVSSTSCHRAPGPPPGRARRRGGGSERCDHQNVPVNALTETTAYLTYADGRRDEIGGAT